MSVVQDLLMGLMTGGLYALIALGIVLIFKSSRVLNLAQGQLVVLGAWICWEFIGRKDAGGLELPLWLGFLLTFAVCAGMGLFLERLILRPLIGESVFTLVMMTVALWFAIDGLVMWIWLGGMAAYPRFIPEEPLQIGGIILGQEYLWMFIIAMILFGLLTLFFRFTRAGIAMRATAEEHRVAQGVGIKVKSVFAQTWVIATLVAAIGGILLGSTTGVSYFMGVMGLRVLPVVIIGGLESITGAIVGGLAIGLLERVAAIWINPYLEAFSEVFPFIILLIILIIKPYGLFGLKRIERI